MLPRTSLIIPFFVLGLQCPSLTGCREKFCNLLGSFPMQGLKSTLPCIPSHPAPTHPNHQTHLAPTLTILIPSITDSSPSPSPPRAYPPHPISHPATLHPSHPESTLPNHPSSPPRTYTLPYLSTPLPHSLDFLSAAWCHNVINYTPDQ